MVTAIGQRRSPKERHIANRLVAWLVSIRCLLVNAYNCVAALVPHCDRCSWPIIRCTRYISNQIATFFVSRFQRADIIHIFASHGEPRPKQIPIYDIIHLGEKLVDIPFTRQEPSTQTTYAILIPSQPNNECTSKVWRFRQH